ncbi:MAG: lytic transglycosylase [Halioglobus sp.]|nr:lytic transglycosylase [Halioglobus sp.]
MLRLFITVISCFVLLAGCQSLPVEEPPASAPQDDSAELSDEQPQLFAAPGPEAPAAPAEDLWQRMAAQLSWQELDNEQVSRARERFLGQRDYLSVVSNRANYYLYHIVEEVERRELPMELALLPLVESTLNPFASSPSHAAGLWQIMPATGRHLGLEQDWWYDGRRDLRDSTRVALDYLEHLHAEFDGDWLLALAAYNSGKGRVGRAMKNNARNGLPTDYWSLRLPRETRHYVPRLIALAQIVAAPQRYGVSIPSVPNRPSFAIVNTGGQLEIVRAAELAGIDIGTLRAFNPGQLRWATSPDMPPELLLPVDSVARFEQGLATLDPDERVQWQFYRIERGDTLGHIARRFDTEIGLLREVNGIRGSRIRAGDTMMIPRGGAWESSLAFAREEPTKARRGYRVRRGDSLYRIAGRFNVSINDIIAWNSLDPDAYLQPGQQLTLYVSGG